MTWAMRINGTTGNSNAVGAVSQGADSSYNQPQMDKMDGLIRALRR